MGKFLVSPKEDAPDLVGGIICEKKAMADIREVTEAGDEPLRRSWPTYVK